MFSEIHVRFLADDSVFNELSFYIPDGDLDGKPIFRLWWRSLRWLWRLPAIPAGVVQSPDPISRRNKPGLCFGLSFCPAEIFKCCVSRLPRFLAGGWTARRAAALAGSDSVSLSFH